MTKPPDKTALDLTGHGHDSHGLTSRREFEHKGHTIVIEAEYRITVDGVERNAMITVGPDGKATTHAIPYKVYGSLVDLMKDLVDLYPDDFAESDPDAGGHHGHSS